MTNETAETVIPQKEQPPLRDLQRALAVSVFDITKSDGAVFQGCAELSQESVLRSGLPPLQPSTTRILILEAPFSPKNPGVSTTMPDWFTQFDDARLSSINSFNVWSLRHFWTSPSASNLSERLWTSEYVIRKKKTSRPGKSLLKTSPHLQGGWLQFGRSPSSRVHLWRCVSSFYAEFLEDGAVQGV
ncbi:hypothetical protein QQZ08_008005 [Neonectria magnoliae]|uniref:Uncharacterized protein n=1 Tax=Neonectria magnoliae TaxID=2732573 RepID=A0ABR1HXA0_9HYPO